MQVLRASQDQFEKANDSLISRIKELEFKLVTRESRPEDLERIAQLEKEVAEKVRPACCVSPLHLASAMGQQEHALKRGKPCARWQHTSADLAVTRSGINMFTAWASAIL